MTDCAGLGERAANGGRRVAGRSVHAGEAVSEQDVLPGVPGDPFVAVRDGRGVRVEFTCASVELCQGDVDSARYMTLRVVPSGAYVDDLLLFAAVAARVQVVGGDERGSAIDGVQERHPGVVDGVSGGGTTMRRTGDGQEARTRPVRLPRGRLGGWDELGDERCDPGLDLVADGAYGVDALAGRVGEHPVLVPLAGVERAGVAAAHGDDHVGGFDGFGGEDLGLLGREVDALLEHGLTHGGVDRLCGRRAGGQYVDAAFAEVA